MDIKRNYLFSAILIYRSFASIVPIEVLSRSIFVDRLELQRYVENYVKTHYKTRSNMYVCACTHFKDVHTGESVAYKKIEFFY